MQPLTPRARKLSRGNGPLAAIARLSRLSDHDGAVFDVGVNRGTIARHLVRIFPACPSYLFEPLPEQAAELRDRFGSFENLQVVERALGERNGKADFHVGTSPGTSSLFTSDGDLARHYHNEAQVKTTIKVDVQSLDSFCAKEGITKISCMKIDAQGAELLIFKGAKKMLKAENIDILMFEWFAVPHYDDCPLFHDLWGYLAGHGYAPYGLYPGRNVPGTGQLRFGDAVFISDRFRRENLQVLAKATPEPELLDA